MNFTQILCALFCLSSSSFINAQDCLTLDEVFSTIENFDFKGSRATRHIRVKSFDFHNFSYGDSTSDRNDFFEIGLGSNGDIVEITHNESILKITNFKFQVYDFPAFKLLTYQSKKNEANKKLYYNPVIFVLNKITKNTIVVNFLSQFGKDSEVSIAFDSLPAIRFNKISSVMTLNTNWFPKRLIRISSGQIVFGSEFVYKKNSNEILKERLFFFNIPEYKRDLEFRRADCISTFENLFLEGDALVVSTYPAINPRYASVPLWVFNGSHLYK